MNTKEKMEKLSTQSSMSEIVVTHITIRQSISLLLFKIILIEISSGILVVLIYVLFMSSSAFTSQNFGLTLGYLAFFVGLGCFKIGLMIFVTVQWIEEYYEITPKEIIHKNGFLFKKEERYSIEHLGTLDYDQGTLGRIFNFGTVKFFNWATEKEVSLYLIHNPRKYLKILKSLLPNADSGKHVLREHMVDIED